MAKRMIETNLQEEDVRIEGSLRPQKLTDYIGQSKIKDSLKYILKLQKQEKMLWITYCSMDLPD